MSSSKSVQFNLSNLMESPYNNQRLDTIVCDGVNYTVEEFLTPKVLDNVESILFTKPVTLNVNSSMIFKKLKIIKYAVSDDGLEGVVSVVGECRLFKGSDFDGDISTWIMKNVTDTSEMFMNSKFKGDISLWDMSGVKNMRDMFRNSLFDGDISLWVTSNVTDMDGMFADSVFNQDIGLWDISNVKYMNAMFHNSKFNKNISQWDTSSLDMSGLTRWA